MSIFRRHRSTVRANAIRARQLIVICVVALTSTGAVPNSTSLAAPSAADSSADWLGTVNYFRSMAKLGPVVEDPGMSAAATHHSCYMLYNGITHDETPGLQGYTADGDASGNNSNVAVSSQINAAARSHIELWMTGPFHALGILRPGLKSVGFGMCNLETTPTPWHSGATLDVLHGLTQIAQTAPVVWPGNGATTSLGQFVTESPNPLDFCGWTGQPAGLPILAMMPESFSRNPTATVAGASGAPLDACVLSPKNTSGVAQQILAANNAVVIIPHTKLDPDTYSVSLTTTARNVSWSFTVDPAAGIATLVQPVQPVQPAPTTSPLASGNTLQILTPSRVVDTRDNVGSTSLVGTLARRIQIAGRGGVPDGAKAISANFTVTDAAASGFLTVWNCSTDRPVVSTVNFTSGDTVPNGASVPLDATGGICVYSSADVDLLVDVNGYFGIGGGGKFASVTPARLMDSRVGLGAGGRLAADSVVRLPVTGVAGVPAGVSAVALNVTSVSPSAAGFVTVYPCDGPRPVVSSLNPVPGSVKPNVVITPVAADGTVCLYTLTDVDLVVDITGYLVSSATLKFTSTIPFRLTDTRDRSRVELNDGTGGNPLGGGQMLTIQVAGQRGVAADAKAISANFTVIGSSSSGYLTAWPCGQQPATSTVNFGVGFAVANGAQMPLSAGGQLCVYVSNSVHVILDISGWWS
ncbi:MAG: hypothetical protein JWN39_1893 [Ilumatobacteraceae bacterium]|nr:hypothetical protein [Ilumatobacteraceae bacterium]